MAASFRFRACAPLLAIATLLSGACDAPRIDGVTAAPPSLARATAGPAVSGAIPASGHQGAVTLDVDIIGSGFDSGSRASWQLNGVAYPKITVNSTRFNSATSLTANITIAADAATTTYDIAVTTAIGKKGIGAEMFTVTLAAPLPGLTEGRAISDGGIVAGANGGNVVVWTPTGGTSLIAANAMVWDIDRNGHTIAGKDATDKPVIWTSATTAAGSWIPTTMADLGNGGAVRGIASNAAGDAVLMTGNASSPTGRKNPVVWTRTQAGWQQRINPVPAELAGAWGQAINARGQVVGMDGSGCCSAVYWDSLGVPSTLPPISKATNAAAYSINGDGTMVVGNSGGQGVLWRRTLVGGAYGAWSAAIALESTSAICGRNGASFAYDVNAAGTIIVGVSCGVAVAWRVSNGVVTSRDVLQGLGPPNQSVVYGINDATAPLAVGTAKNSAGVYWWGF
jgi:hypothetical protein